MNEGVRDDQHQKQKHEQKTHTHTHKVALNPFRWITRVFMHLIESY